MKLYGSYTSPFVRHCRVALAPLIQAGEVQFIEADYAMSADLSPTAKVPFLVDDDLTLTDSSSIVKYAREKMGSGFLTDLGDYEIFTLANTLLDATVNVFLFENEGIAADTIPYLQRQNRRIETSLAALNRWVKPTLGITTDGQLRCACYIDWAMFRKRADFSPYPNLLALVAAANENADFTTTAPPGA